MVLCVGSCWTACVLQYIDVWYFVWVVVGLLVYFSTLTCGFAHHSGSSVNLVNLFSTYWIMWSDEAVWCWICMVWFDLIRNQYFKYTSQILHNSGCWLCCGSFSLWELRSVHCVCLALCKVLCGGFYAPYVLYKHSFSRSFKTELSWKMSLGVLPLSPPSPISPALVT